MYCADSELSRTARGTKQNFKNRGADVHTDGGHCRAFV